MMLGIFGGRRASRFEIDVAADPAQILAPPDKSDNFEGVAFSPSGNVLGVAAANTHTVYLYRRTGDGRFEDTPYARLGGRDSLLDYPHDVAFAAWGETELLAVAQRRSAITLFEKNRASDMYGPEPAFDICGPATNLEFTDAVAFVPPDNDLIAACNTYVRRITFYRRASQAPVRFALEPVFQIEHPCLAVCDGLAFTGCGTWLAVASHGSRSIALFRRRPPVPSGNAVDYGSAPFAVIKDRRLRYPHSVAFTPGTNHLVVTNAGANYFCVYEPTGRDPDLRWARSPVLTRIFGPEHIFKDVNRRLAAEGGPKGVAIHDNRLAVCSPEHGVKLYSFTETAADHAALWTGGRTDSVPAA